MFDGITGQYYLRARFYDVVNKIDGAEVEEFHDPRSGRKQYTITVQNEDDLFDIYEMEKDGKEYTEDIGGNFWTSSDKSKRIEFSEGHEPSPRNPEGEGPHVKVLEPKDTLNPTNGWWTSPKY